MNSLHNRFAFVTLALVATACATLADAETGGENLPNAAAGPFRELRADEVGNLRSAPNVLVDDRTFPRDGTVIDADGDPATSDVFGYFAVAPLPSMGDPNPTTPTRAIVRYAAPDGRSFDRAPVTILELEQPWEGGRLGAPSALWVGTEIFLYYASAGGIGLARSSDAEHFTRESAPVLGLESSGWDAGNVPASPGVVRLDDGSFRMFYDVEYATGQRVIGEARSKDGITWERVGNVPVLSWRGDIDPNDPNYDGVSVEAPYPVLGKSTEGRSILRVYFGAVDSLGRRSIALAARYDSMYELEFHPLDRAVGPVFNDSLGPGQPFVDVRPGYSLLFVTQLEGTTKSKQIPAIAAAVSPADAILPARSEN
jgi:hypothetical protein